MVDHVELLVEALIVKGARRFKALRHSLRGQTRDVGKTVVGQARSSREQIQGIEKRMRETQQPLLLECSSSFNDVGDILRSAEDEVEQV